MVGRKVKLFNGYRFYISDEGKNWVSKKIYSNINQAHTIMLSVMEFGIFSDWTEQVVVGCEKQNNKELVLV